MYQRLFPKLGASLVLVYMVSWFGISPASAHTITATSTPLLPGAVRAYSFAGDLNTPANSPVVSNGPLFYIDLPCQATNTQANSMAAMMQLGGFASSGALNDMVSANRSTTQIDIDAQSALHGVSLLNGLITLQSLTVDAHSHADSLNTTSQGSTQFVGLSVAGVAMQANPAPNSKVALVGVGEVILNEQYSVPAGTDYSSMNIDAIDLVVTMANSFGLPVDTHVLIGRAAASFTRTAVPSVVAADGAGLQITGMAGTLQIESGPWSLAVIGCVGGNATANLASLLVGNLFTAKAIKSAATGNITSQGSVAASDSELQQVSVFNGLITFGTIVVQANAADDSAAGNVTFTSMQIAGGLIAVNPVPNTKVALPGIGYVLLNEQYLNASSLVSSVEVIGVAIYVTTANVFGLPIGAQMNIGVATASTNTY